LSDTFRILQDAAGKAGSSRLAQLQKDLKTACDFRPATLAAARRSLARLASSAADVAQSFEPALAVADAIQPETKRSGGHTRWQGNAKAFLMS